MKRMNRFLSALLAICMMVGLLPMTALPAQAAADVWNGSDVATAFAGGTGTAADPFQISTGAQLAYFRNQVNSGTDYAGQYIKLMDDIALNEGELGDSSNEWTPIGNNSNRFSGTFDGAGHEVSGLYINSSEGYLGLFGFAEDSWIINLGVFGDVTGSASSARVGGVVGLLYGNLKNCYSGVTITATGSNVDVGGVVGQNYGTVVNSYNTGDISSSGQYTNAGGVVGTSVGTSEISFVINCYNTGTVTGVSGADVGGVVGYNSVADMGSGPSEVNGGYFLKTAEINASLNAIGSGDGTVNNALSFGTDGTLSGTVNIGSYTGDNLLAALNAGAAAYNDGSTGVLAKMWHVSADENNNYPMHLSGVATVIIDKPDVTVDGAADVTVNASAKDASGLPASGITWSVEAVDNSDEGVLIDASTGVITVSKIADVGDYTITATFGGSTATATLTVARAASVPTSITVGGGFSVIGLPTAEDGGTDDGPAFTATVKDQYGASMSGQTVTWSIPSAPIGVRIHAGTGVVTVTSDTQLIAAVENITVTATLSSDADITGSASFAIVGVTSISIFTEDDVDFSDPIGKEPITIAVPTENTPIECRLICLSPNGDPLIVSLLDETTNTTTNALRGVTIMGFSGNPVVASVSKDAVPTDSMIAVISDGINPAVTFQIKLVDLAFTHNDNPVALGNGITHANTKKYGDSWEEIVIVSDDILTNTTINVEGTYKVVGTDAGNVDQPLGGSNNYEVLFSDKGGSYSDVVVYSGTIEVDKLDLTWTNGAVANKIYDGDTTTTITTEPILRGIINDDDVTVTSGSASFSDKNAASGKVVTATGYLVGGTDAANYNLLTAQPIFAAANITKKAVTVTAADKSRVYGLANPDFTLEDTSSVLVAGDTEADLAVALAAAATYTSDVGDYTITGTSASANYAVTVTPGTLTINPATYTGDQTLENATKQGASGSIDLKVIYPFATGFSYDSKKPNDDSVIDGTPTIAEGVLNYEVAASAATTEAEADNITVTVSSANYQDFTVTIDVKITDKDVPTLSANDLVETYTGAPFDLGDITGKTAVGTDGTTAVTGSWSIKGAPNLTDANLGIAVTLMFTSGDASYADATKTITVTIGKATPTGTPTFTPMTEAGKTLADASLRAPSGGFNPDGGTLAWDMGDAALVVANVAYGWTYTPTDTANYTVLTGSITPYQVSTGGGGGGGGSSTTPDNTVDSEAPLTSDALKKFAESGEPLTVNGDDGVEIEFDTAALEAILDEAEGRTVEFIAKEADPSVVNDAQKIVIGDNLVLDLRVLVDGVEFTDFLTGVVTISLPYELEDGETAANLKVYYVDAQGNKTLIESSFVDGILTFKTNHFSLYMVLYEAMSFTDVLTGDWYYDAVLYVFENEIMTGTSDTTFAPSDNMTRAMVWTVLARMSGINTDGGEPWYSVAQDWATENEVSDGTNPDGYITREEFATMLFRYAAPENVTQQTMLGQFSDGESVSEWAVSAMEWAVAEGIITGMEDGTLSPQGEATRAQMATMLMRYLTME